MGSEWSPKSVNQFLQAFDFASELDEKEALHQKEITAIFQRFLDIKDSLEAILLDQAFEKKSTSKEATILSQIELLERQLTLAFANCDVTAIECIGQEADPNLHYVVGVIEHETAAPDVIVEEKLKGYYYRDRLLRRPQVIVSGSKLESN